MEPITDTELVMGNVYGYRTWYISQGYIPFLYPLFGPEDRPWLPGINEAKCFRDPKIPKHSLDLSETISEHGLVPDQECGCGFWAYLTPNGNYLDLKNIHGVVRASGRVQLHERGMRAQKMEIVALFTMIPLPARQAKWYGVLDSKASVEQMKRIANFYKVPWFNTSAEMIKHFPPTLKPEIKAYRDPEIITPKEDNHG